MVARVIIKLIVINEVLVTKGVRERFVADALSKSSCVFSRRELDVFERDRRVRQI